MMNRMFAVTAALLGLAILFGFGATLAAAETETSSACINCHTDLDRMDKYGAAAASGGASIAG